jgi:hypothetical protein
MAASLETADPHEKLKVVKIFRSRGDCELIVQPSGLVELPDLFKWQGELRLELCEMTRQELEELPEWDGP